MFQRMTFSYGQERGKYDPEKNGIKNLMADVYQSATFEYGDRKQAVAARQAVKTHITKHNLPLTAHLYGNSVVVNK